MDATLDTAIDEAARLFRDGRAAEAAQRCSAILEREPANPEANTLLGTVRLMNGDVESAVGCFRTAIAGDPQSFDAHKGLGIALVNLGQFQDAAAALRTALSIRPDSAEAHYDLGVLLLDGHRLRGAVARLRRAIELKPDMAEAHFNLAVALGESGDHEAAIASYSKVLELRPEFVEAHYNLGIELTKLGRHAMAIANFQKVVDERPDFAEAHLSLGVALRLSGYIHPAIESYRRALEINPNYAAAHSNLGIALNHTQSTDEAIASFRRAIAADPEYAEAYFNLGTALSNLSQDDAARENLLKAISIDPDYADAHRNLAAILSRGGRHGEAAEALQKALNLGTPDAGLLTDLGNELVALRRTELAIASYRQALDLDPRHVAALHGLCVALNRARRYKEAIACCEAALEINRADTMALDMLADLSRHLCAWKDIGKVTEKLVQIVEARWGGVTPFWFLALVDDPAAHLACAQQYWQAKKIETAPPVREVRADAGKLRVGYFSADLNQHATAYLITELLELHDKSQFEIVVFSHGPDDQGTMRARVARAVDRVIDVHGQSDRAIAAKIRSERIDILVDLDGHTRRSRLQVLARRPAPVQVHYLGYPGSLGVDFIDYALVDSFVAPPGQDGHYTEKLVRLPNCYQVSDRKRSIADPGPTRADCGLPAEGFVFCCFNNTYKLTPEMFDIWMRLLQATPGSVLWLLSNIEDVKENLRAEAAARGVDPGRLVFAGFAPSEIHLARHRLADLSLDTLPYNSHTLANDALWAGLPLVTCPGRAFPARVAGSLLHAVGLPELVTADLGAYETLARTLAHDPAALATIRQKLARNIATAPLFDTDRARQAFEAAYRRMWEIRKRGEAPRAFAVA